MIKAATEEGRGRATKEKGARKRGESGKRGFSGTQGTRPRANTGSSIQIEPSARRDMMRRLNTCPTITNLAQCLAMPCLALGYAAQLAGSFPPP